MELRIAVLGFALALPSGLACGGASIDETVGPTDGGVTTTGTSSSGLDGSGGDATSGDGDGTSGDGDSSGDGDESSGDGDGSSGDGDGTSGDGDGTSGDGDGTSGDGDGTSGDGDGTAGDGDGDGCFNEMLTFTGTPPSIMLVLDQSGSMNSVYDHDNDPGTPDVSKWEALHIALTQILATYDGSAEFGVQLFPGDGYCGALPSPEVPMAAMNASNVLAAIPAASANVGTGATPTGSGLEAALAYLSPYPAAGEKAIILMADGGVSDYCGNPPNDVPPILTMLTAAYNGGVDPTIPTYVIGINASATLGDQLNMFAAAGGVPQTGAATDYYDAQDTAGLFMALDAIIGQLVTCTINLSPPPPPGPDAVDVAVAGTTYDELDPTAPGFDCAAQDGWYFVDPDTIELCGVACTTFEGLAPPTAEITYFCTGM